ncbi:ATP-binding protein [Flavilitoribacter nigricans]|uniref:Novel STAND NTPase 1 domain-containing protein n=1 Tax=Flavilitoribacter nigricans (strain ATCC 23147 / DSM 23189 / NBRC 102662 / NCIMB 1420 / SS-2) TaxID=1122177 RepID=A0A2D0MXD2_FLAN2|nr:ATP-binding protein [Flavilitoribacter nigricans]PHN00895.1 hypothetical protein CRP01_39845 [Flavilitoribacter nigricans DSM 23189 = NBRC 102662]
MSPNNSPFKFLDAYTKADKDIFFGRDDEVELLYDLVWRSNLTLVYGQSGTGKTSLVKCGLANRFAESDWFDVHIRRNEDINQSLLDNLEQFEPEEKDNNSKLREMLMRKRQGIKRTKSTNEKAKNEVIHHLRSLYKNYLKPIFLIFDQFEELFILGSQEEQSIFYETIAEILDTENYCRVILIMREESIAQLYDFERIVPFLFDKRLRVEPMGRSKTDEVITRTTKQFGIELGDQQVGSEIINVLAGGQGRVELTYLQVFLDQLYQAAAEEERDQITFTTPLVERFGNIEDVLGDFLSRQTLAIQLHAASRFPNINANAVNKLLNAFVTLEGTKRPLRKEEVRVGKLEKDQINFIVDELEQKRILRFDNKRLELAHDALASKVAETRTADEVALLQIANIVNNRQKEFAATKTLLNANELGLINVYRRRLEEEELLTPVRWDFVNRSAAANRRRRLTLAGIVLAVIASLATLALIANGQRLNAQEKATEAQENLEAMLEAQENERAANYQEYLSRGNAQMAQSRYAEAIQSYEVALTFDSTGTEAQDSLVAATSKSDAGSIFNQLMSEGDELYARGMITYIDAMRRYQEALALGFNNSLAQGRINELTGKLVTAFDTFKDSGDRFFNAAQTDQATSSYRYALEQYRNAAKIRPNNRHIQERIRQCLAKIN